MYTKKGKFGLCRPATMLSGRKQARKEITMYALEKNLGYANELQFEISELYIYVRDHMTLNQFDSTLRQMAEEGHFQLIYRYTFGENYIEYFVVMFDF
jgi:hypothetical protein